jgi:hypothetical protein
MVTLLSRKRYLLFLLSAQSMPLCLAEGARAIFLFDRTAPRINMLNFPRRAEILKINDHAMGRRSIIDNAIFDASVG